MLIMFLTGTTIEKESKFFLLIATHCLHLITTFSCTDVMAEYKNLTPFTCSLKGSNVTCKIVFKSHFLVSSFGTHCTMYMYTCLLTLHGYDSFVTSEMF